MRVIEGHDPEACEMGDDEDDGGGEISKAIAVFLGLCYAIGLLTINLFLHSNGITDFTLLRPRAILTGAIVIGSLSVIAFGPLAMAAKIAESHDIMRPWRMGPLGLIALLSPLLVVFAICWFMDPSLEPLSTADFSWEMGRGVRLSQSISFAVQFYLSSCISAILAIQLIRMYWLAADKSSFAGIANAWGKLIIYSTAFVIAVAWFVSTFAGFIYIRIPRQFGGGEPEKLRFSVKHDSVQMVKALGIKFVENTNVTTQQLVIHESDDGISMLVEYASVPETLKDGSTSQVMWETTVTLDKKLIDASIVDTDPGHNEMDKALTQLTNQSH